MFIFILHILGHATLSRWLGAIVAVVLLCGGKFGGYRRCTLNNKISIISRQVPKVVIGGKLTARVCMSGDDLYPPPWTTVLLCPYSTNEKMKKSKPQSSVNGYLNCYINFYYIINTLLLQLYQSEWACKPLCQIDVIINIRFYLHHYMCIISFRCRSCTWVLFIPARDVGLFVETSSPMCPSPHLLCIIRNYITVSCFLLLLFFFPNSWPRACEFGGIRYQDVFPVYWNATGFQLSQFWNSYCQVYACVLLIFRRCPRVRQL